MIVSSHGVNRISAQPPMIIAEIGAAHNGSLDDAIALIRAAKEAGADAVKFQAYLPETITYPSSRPEFTIQSGPWMGRTLHDLYEESHTPRAWFEQLYRCAEIERIQLFPSVFSLDDLIHVEAYFPQTPYYKIASFELVDHELIRGAARTGKSVILSTGMATEEEVAEAYWVVRETEGHAMPVLLHCVSAYPTPLSGAGIGCIPLMQARFSCPVGLSDHTIGNEAGILAAGAGARIIEKHLTLDRRRGGPDDGFASGPGEFREFCQAVKMAHEACSLQTAAEETAHAGLRRSLYIVKDVEAGERVTRDNVRSIRPGNGLHPKHLPTVLGKLFKRGAQGGTPLSSDFVE